jgi:prepilin-type N-terminal cleavage/methylation domain-containing protein
MRARIPTRTAGRSAGAERGVTLIEVIIVLLIIAILAAIVLAGKNSTKRAGAVSAARAAGASYNDAIEAFVRDHGGRTPVWNNGNDWPSTPPAGSGVSGGAGGLWGPINAGARGKPYLDKIPEAVQGGRVVVVSSGTSTSSPGLRSRVVYNRISDREYALLVQRATSSSWATVCEFGTGGGTKC